MVFPFEIELESLIAATLNRSANERSRISSEIFVALDKVLAGLDSGLIRAVDPLGPGRWRINRLVVRAIELSSQLSTGNLTRAGDLGFFDHLPTKFAGLKQADLVASGIRVVPPAVTRRGSYLGRDVVLMPSFVGVGAYVDDGSMIDSWASVGRCAQVGKKVHVSVNAVVGDSSAQDDMVPAVVEDNCFVGAGVVIADGVIVEAHSVIGMGVLVDRHTPIYDRGTGAFWYRRIPSGSVVVAGSMPGGNGGLAQPCALIVKCVDEQTRAKVNVNDLLRN
jgi:2,3,4,5-tetrahydropyridine-2,6-dicarboxylate N-succinyltransferase